RGSALAVEVAEVVVGRLRLLVRRPVDQLAVVDGDLGAGFYRLVGDLGACATRRASCGRLRGDLRAALPRAEAADARVALAEALRGRRACARRSRARIALE